MLPRGAQVRSCPPADPPVLLSLSLLFPTDLQNTAETSTPGHPPAWASTRVICYHSLVSVAIGLMTQLPNILDVSCRVAKLCLPLELSGDLNLK